MRADYDRGARLARQGTDYIAGILINALLLNRTPNVIEQIPNCCLTFPGCDGATFQAALYQSFNGQVYF